MIPKVIYYTWFGGTDEPISVKENVRTWASFFPDYQIKRIDEKSFDVTQSCFSQEAFRTQNWAFLSDYARYATLYKNGGLYFDTDVVIVRNFEELFDSDKYTSYWALENSDSINSGSFFAAEPLEKNVQKILDYYDSISVGHQMFNLTTPQIVTKCFEEMGFEYQNKFQSVNGAAIFPVDYFSPIHWWGGGRITKRTKAVHKFNGDWVNLEGESFIVRNRGRIRNYIKQSVILYFPNVYKAYKSRKRRR